jgi:phage baseplate assembly protein W
MTSMWPEDESFGVDLEWRDDLSATAREITGEELLEQEVHHRLSTPRGALITDPDFGMDLRAELSQKASSTRRASLIARIRGELTKDDRILDVKGKATWTGNTVDVQLKIYPSDGQPFDMVLGVTDAAVRINAGD